MPATCFTALPRSVGVIAAALACELAGALRDVVALRRAPSASQPTLLLWRAKMQSPGICARLRMPLLRAAAPRLLACLLVSYTASPLLGAGLRQGLTIKPKARK